MKIEAVAFDSAQHLNTQDNVDVSLGIVLEQNVSARLAPKLSTIP